MQQIFAIATTTVGEAIRRKVLLVILLIAMLLLSIIPALGVLSTRSEMTTMISTIYFVIRATSALIAIVLTIYMIPNEIERRTIYTILCKPVQRWQFLVGKYLGSVMALALMMGIMTILALIVFYVFRKPDIAKVIEVAKQPMLYLIEMSLLSAIAIFFSTFVAPLVNFFISIGLWLMGTVLNPLYESFATNPTTPPMMKSLARFITGVFPNFSNYDVKNSIMHTSVIQNEFSFYIGTVGYGIMYISILLIAGVLIFDRREV